jgi:glycosyltransferase involved in cell wall biosynthesis
MRLVGGGVLVEKDDPSALAAGIRELMEAPERRRSLGATARERVDTHLSWRRVAAVTADGYAEVLDERRGRPTRTMTSANVG